ncbi:MAG: glycosyltransferase [Bacilli bacterium]|nr:glycosyltransferase [Bacilli bacterium]
MKDLISVIVPCYNVEKYISKCLDSIINQTYSNLEIILVEDCSKDDTLKAIKKYLKKDNRIKLIQNKKNSGLSFSRNAGMKVANGKYLSFIDSDDYIDLNFYELLYKAIKKENADIAICDMKIIYEDNNQELISKCYSDDEFNLLSVVNNGLAASACNKLFKNDGNIYEFEVGKVNEDIAVVIPLLVNSKKIAYANTYYNYIQRKGSIQNSGFSDKRFDIFYGVNLTLKRIINSKYYNDIKEALIFNQIIVLLLYAIPKEKNKEHRKNILKKYSILSKEYNIRQNKYFGSFLRDCGKKHRIYYKALFKLVCEGHYFLANNLISTYDFLYKILKKKTIKDNISIDDVVNKAIYQSNLKEEDIKVSVIVPNYNYARFMYQRIYSILSQNYKISELIILDDKSSDDSKNIIEEIVNKTKNYINIKSIYNKENSGSAFIQWQKGFENACSDYVWIAEADDYCQSNLLSNLIKPIKKDNSIVISYSDTAFIDIFGNITLKSIKKEIDILNTKHWDNSYVNKGIEEINNYSYLNNTIANVSSCLIKNNDYSAYFKKSSKYKQAGDWLFYVNVIKDGDISYINKPLNYYRVHGNNVSSTTKKDLHLKEIETIYKEIDEIIKFNNIQKKNIQNRIDFLKKVWKLK